MGRQHEVPPEVRRAQRERDTEALRALGSKGGKAAAESNRHRKEDKKDREEFDLLEASLHEAQLENDAEKIRHYEERVRQWRQGV